MKITPELLVAAVGCTPSIAVGAAPALQSAFDARGVQSPERISAFLAQVGQESKSFTRTREDMRYSKPETLMRTWPKRFPSREFAIQYLLAPEKLANYVYANRLGNGDIASGDGWNFRGGGWSQITGRDTWARFVRDTGIDIIKSPELVDTPTVAALTAVWFWDWRSLFGFADRDDYLGYRAMTVALNGALVGFEDGNDWGNDDRVERWNTARLACGLQLRPAIAKG